MKNSVIAGAIISSFPIHESFTVISGTCSSYPATLRETRNRLILHWSVLSDARGRIVDDDQPKEWRESVLSGRLKTGGGVLRDRVLFCVSVVRLCGCDGLASGDGDRVAVVETGYGEADRVCRPNRESDESEEVYAGC